MCVCVCVYVYVCVCLRARVCLCVCVHICACICVPGLSRCCPCCPAVVRVVLLLSHCCAAVVLLLSRCPFCESLCEFCYGTLCLCSCLCHCRQNKFKGVHLRASLSRCCPGCLAVVPAVVPLLLVIRDRGDGVGSCCWNSQCMRHRVRESFCESFCESFVGPFPPPPQPPYHPKGGLIGIYIYWRLGG